MRELAGWEWLLGAALVAWLLWRLGNASVSSLGDQRREREETNNDWMGLLLPLVAVVIFVLLLIAGLRQ